MRTAWHSGDVAEAIAALPASGPLPLRTVVVPHERAAHALRRALLERGHSLLGLRFASALGLAEEILAAAGVALRTGEEALRPLRVERWLAGSPTLAHFSLAHLRSTRGWGEAFARSLGDLESAGLRPEGLPEGPLWHDLAACWRAVDASAALSCTSPRLLGEAAAALRDRPELWTHGAALAAVDGHERAATLAFLRAVPGLELILLPARPRRSHHAGRLSAMIDLDAGATLRETPAPAGAPGELGVLQEFFLEGPERLFAAERRRSSGPDASLVLEQHAGVEDELEAASEWIVRTVEDGFALEDIAVLAPSPEILPLLADRLRRLPWPGGELPVVVEGGLPIAGDAAGARLLTLLRALQAHLSIESLLPLLPHLTGFERRLSPAAAGEVLGSLGAAGGSPASPAGALVWVDRLDARLRRDATWLAAHPAGASVDDNPRVTRERGAVERSQARLDSLRPALAELVRLARLRLRGAPLAELGEGFLAFAERHLRLPGAAPLLLARLREGLAPALANPTLATAQGDEALQLLDVALHQLRVPAGRFGAPAVYLGTVRGATALSFRAVRVLGLCEGTIPPGPREDPVLPNAERERLTPAMLDGRVVSLAALHALDRVIRQTRERLVLSAPRVDGSGTQREPSAIFVEVGTALGRWPRRVPSGHELRRDAFAPAHRAARSRRLATPVGAAAWLERGVLPISWQQRGALSLERLRELGARDMEEGLLAGDLPMVLPGLDPARPISASTVQKLLECPHRFLLDKLLGWGERGGLPALDQIPALVYGSLVHLVAERFFTAHGTPLAAGEGNLGGWQTLAVAYADLALDELLLDVSLAGPAIVAQQRRRLHRDVRQLVALEFRRPPRRFVAAERAFGYTESVALTVGSNRLHVHGQIDLLERDASTTFVRDFKTGKGHPRSGEESGPVPVRDVQLALYARAALELAGAWDLPTGHLETAYVYVSAQLERGFAAGELLPAAEAWFATAVRLLREQHFPRTPIERDCWYCHFAPVCGPDAALISAERLVRSPAAHFAAIRLAGEDDT